MESKNPHVQDTYLFTYEEWNNKDNLTEDDWNVGETLAFLWAAREISKYYPDVEWDGSNILGEPEYLKYFTYDFYKGFRCRNLVWVRKSWDNLKYKLNEADRGI